MNESKDLAHLFLLASYHNLNLIKKLAPNALFLFVCFLSSIEEDKVPISESHHHPLPPQGEPIHKNYYGQLNVIIIMIINSTNSDICTVHNVSQHDNFICLYDLYKGKMKLNSII